MFPPERLNKLTRCIAFSSCSGFFRFRSAVGSIAFVHRGKEKDFATAYLSDVMPDVEPIGLASDATREGRLD